MANGESILPRIASAISVLPPTTVTAAMFLPPVVLPRTILLPGVFLLPRLPPGFFLDVRRGRYVHPAVAPLATSLLVAAPLLSSVADIWWFLTTAADWLGEISPARAHWSLELSARADWLLKISATADRLLIIERVHGG